MEKTIEQTIQDAADYLSRKQSARGRPKGKRDSSKRKPRKELPKGIKEFR